jgi:hypothetical protein
METVGQPHRATLQELPFTIDAEAGAARDK